MSKLYRRRDVLVEAVQYTGDNLGEVISFIKGTPHEEIHSDTKTIIVEASNGMRELHPYHWVVKFVNGNIYTYTNDLFWDRFEEENTKSPWM